VATKKKKKKKIHVNMRVNNTTDFISPSYQFLILLKVIVPNNVSILVTNALYASISH
jgi:hypothetical protein